MAICKGPALSLEASGNVGALSYTTWRGRQVVRSTWNGTQTSTASQVVIRVIMTNISQAWGGTLTEGQRRSWNELASILRYPDRFGTMRHPTGYHLFIKWNCRRRALDEGGILLYPVRSEIPMIGALDTVVNLLIPQVAITLTPLDLDASGYGFSVWRAGAYTSQGRNPIEGEFRLLGTAGLLANYYDVNVSPAEIYWYKAAYFTSYGEEGNYIYKQVIIE